MSSIKEPQLAGGPTPPLRIPLRADVTLIPSLHGGGPAATPDPILREVALFQLIANHPDQQRRGLRWDAELQRVARLRCEDMRLRRYINHVNPDGDGPNTILRRNGVSVPAWYDTARDANNVESLRLGPDDPADAFAALLASPHHAEHILGRGFFVGQTRMGIGAGVDWDDPPRQWIFCILSIHGGD